MNPKEQEIAISELEDRVDRLRNIYEQYFLGFERLEPTVPRKDVDRRFALLRKEQIRNTAMRFRFNVIAQKYNTYAMHWVRICRQIEEGTYKRHVRRAKARFGDGPDPIERDISIDIDTTEFDMESVLDEINAENERRERLPPDTVRPPPSVRAAASARAILGTPGSSFAIAGRSGNDLERTTDTGVHVVGERSARGAALPPGTKPRMIVRKREEGDTSPGSPASVRVPAALPAGAPPGSSPSAGRLANAPPAASSGRIPNAGPPAAGRIPVAQPAPGTAPGGSPSPASGHQHVAPKGAPERPQIRPVGNRTPVSTPRVPIAPPPSNPRAPVAPLGGAPQRPPPIPPPSARMPAAPLPPGSARIATAPGSSPRLPVPPLPMMPRAPMPSYVDKDTEPGAPGTRPRIPLPLPSQSGRPTKKD